VEQKFYDLAVILAHSTQEDKTEGEPMFNVQDFIEECCAALKENDAHAAIKEIIARAVAQPVDILKALGEPKLAGIQPLYRSDSLTIINFLWGPCMRLYPHNHLMWAVIGVYGGREDNIFYRRAESGLQEVSGKSLETRDVIPLGSAVIHAVTNPLEQITAGIHVYGGDFFAVPRSEWDPQTFEERPFDLKHAVQVFEESNSRLRDAVAGRGNAS
jgi:predicted metal-dependent enzyme (double-stranded beta helix superfamily)